MSDLALAGPTAPTASLRTQRAGHVVGRLTARKALRSGVLWGYVFGVVVASSALTYSTLYKTQADRTHLAAAFGANKAASALFGPAPQLQTVAGFTVFKSFLSLMIVGAVWALLMSTKALRGEEDAGRWEILLTGQTTRRGATIQALAGLGAGVFTSFVITAIIIALAGQSSKVGIAPGAAVYFALALVASAVMFVAVGAFTSQLASTRRQAASYAAAFLGVSYAIRMVADAGIGLHGLIWASPLGWVEQLQPLIAPHPVAFLPIIAFTVVVAGAAVTLAGRRDLGASLLPDRASGPPHLRWLDGPGGLAVRTLRPVVMGWWVAIAVTGLLTGLVAKAAGQTLSGSSLQQVFSRLGATGAGAKAFLGVSFLIVAVLIAFFAAGQVVALRGEESAGRLDQLLVRPLGRAAWLGGRLQVAVAVVLAGGVLGGLFTWLATATQGSAVSLVTLLGAGVNVVPPALCVLGIGVLAFGAWPRRASVVMYTVVGWSLLVEVIGGIGAESHWLIDTSLFHQMASAPAVAPNWTVNAVLVAIGAVCALVGAILFARRDLMGE